MAKRLDCCVLVWSTLAKKGSWVVGPNWIQLPLTSLALSFPVEERERESLVYTIFLGKYYPSHMFQHQSFMADHKEHNFFYMYTADSSVFSSQKMQSKCFNW